MLLALLVFYPNHAAFFSILCSTKNGQNSKNDEFYSPLILTNVFGNFVCSFNGFKYPISSNVSSFVLILCCRWLKEVD